MKLSNQDRKDLDKYTKFLALKSVQIIIQSRIGEKIHTLCNPTSKGSDWVNFNLSINDFADVSADSKRVFNLEELATSKSLCVEISLQTPEKDTMVLESWCLGVLPEQCDPTLKNIHTVYNRMGILLKSLVSVTRVVPAYKLSRRQGSDSYVICYRVYMGQQECHNLGDGSKEVRIGQICSPTGTLQLSVAYRTKMTISPTQSSKNNSIMYKSDHFNSNGNVKRHRNIDINDLSKPLRPGPFADAKPKQVPEPELAGVTRLLALGKQKPKPRNRLTSQTDSINSNETEKNSPTPSEKMNTSTSSNASFLKSVDEDYWLKEVSAPFAKIGPMSELMHFYRQCKKPQPLVSPPKTTSVEEFKKMIDDFEMQMPEYDALVQSFCESPDNS